MAGVDLAVQLAQSTATGLQDMVDGRGIRRATDIGA
jgi:hypothetical protein